MSELVVPPGVAVAVVLDACAFATMLALLYPLVSQGLQDTRRRLFSLACFTHLVASALALIQALVASDVPTTIAPSSGLLASLLLDASSLVLLAVSLVRRAQTASQAATHVLAYGMVLASLPSALAMATLPWHGSLACLRFAYALSLTMLQTTLGLVRDRDLTAREAEVSLRLAYGLAEQMRPHFIFNALSTIQGLIYEDPEAAAEQVEQFSDYLRGHMDALGETGLVPFQKEIEHAREYAVLSRAGSSTPFEVVWDLGETDFEVASLTVQPVVENAIRYGALARTDGKGEVRVTSERAGDFARVTIEDNGPGMDLCARREDDRRGIGLASARQRLEVQCDGILTVSSNERGTRVVIVVPANMSARHKPGEGRFDRPGRARMGGARS